MDTILKVDSQMREIVKLYPDAFEASFTIEDAGSNTAAFEVLQAYWRLRNLICANVQRELPNVNCNVLLKLI